MTDGCLRVLLLGPLEVRVGSRPVALTRRQRALVAALLLDAGHVVSVDRIVRRLWDEDPPSAAGARIRSLVAEIRRLLGPDEAAVIVTRSPGYLIDVDRAEVDLLLFEEHVAAATRAAAGQDWAAAIEEYEKALALWRGEPLADLPWAPERQRLNELRAQAAEGRLEAAMSLGRRSGLIAELTRHVREFPLRERPHALLMQALHREGRTAEALEVYASFRQALVDELGIEPTAELAELHRKLLAGALPSAESVPSGGPRPPRQLPPATALFVGRDDQLRRLDDLLDRDVPLAVISGPAGAGKSTLALRWAQSAAHRFPDGQLFLDLRGFDSGERMTPREALPLLLQGLGCPARDVPPTVGAQVALYRTMLADRRVLLVLDDVADRDQIRDLLPGGSNAFTLVTSRYRMGGLAATTGAHLIDCDVLDPGASVALLGRSLGEQRVAAERQAAARLAELCDHLPLALCVAASRIGQDGGAGAIGRFVERLSGQGRISQLRFDGEEHAAVRAALDASYQMLPPAGQEVLRSIGLLPGTGRSVPAIAASIGRGRAEVEEAVAAADRLHLVRVATPGRIEWHDLVHEHATLFLEPADREDARRRLLEHYLRTAVEAARVCGFALSGPPLGPSGPEVEPIVFAGPSAAHAWFDETWPEIAAAITYVAAHGPRPYAWLLLDALRDLLQYRTPLAELSRMTEVALGAAEADGEPIGLAAMHGLAGRVLWRSGDLPGALSEFETAGRLARKVSWPVGEAHSEQGVGIVLKQMGEPSQALSHYRRAVAIFRQAGDQRGEVAALNNLGSAYLVLSRLPQAEEALAQAVPLARLGDQHVRTLVLGNLGEVRYRQGKFDQALAVLNEALSVVATAGSPYARAMIMENMGLVRSETGQYPAAKAAFAEALTLARQVSNRTCEASVLIGLGDLAVVEGRLDDAEIHLHAAAMIAEQIGVTAARSAVLLSEAKLRLAQDRAEEAPGLLEKSAVLATGIPLLLPAVRLMEARALERLGDDEGARTAARDAMRLADESGQQSVRTAAAQLLG